MPCCARLFRHRCCASACSALPGRTMSPKLCPVCRVINRPSAPRCDCGYEFGQSTQDAEDAIGAEMGRHQLRVALFGLLFLVSVAMSFAVSGGAWIFAIGGAGAFGTSVRRLVELRRSLRELPRPPRAHVVSRKE